ncbi:MAG: hypothetical protein AAF387_19420 [Pseudomonadota bacterium]
MSTEATEIVEENRSYLIRVWRGDISLPIMFFGWSILGNIVFIATILTAGNFGHEPTFWTTYVVWYIYGIFIVIALWKSCTKHGGWAGTMIKVCIVLGGLATIVNIAKVVNQPNLNITVPKSPEGFARHFADGMASELPMKVGSGNTLTSVHSEGRDLVYSYIMNVPKDMELNLDVLETTMSEAACNEEQTIFMMRMGVTIRYSYFKTDGEPLTELKVDKWTCVSYETNPLLFE